MAVEIKPIILSTESLPNVIFYEAEMVLNTTQPRIRAIVSCYCSLAGIRQVSSLTTSRLAFPNRFLIVVGHGKNQRKVSVELAFSTTPRSEVPSNTSSAQPVAVLSTLQYFIRSALCCRAPAMLMKTNWRAQVQVAGKMILVLKSHNSPGSSIIVHTSDGEGWCPMEHS